MSHGHTHNHSKKGKGKGKGKGKFFAGLQTRESETDEAYLRIVKAMGNCSFTCINENTGEEVFAKTAGRLTHGPNKKFINPGDLVLAEVIHITANKPQYMIKLVYSATHASSLKKMGELQNLNVDPEAADAAVGFFKDAQQMQDEMDNEINIDDI
jgi:hypothetical protein